PVAVGTRALLVREGLSVRVVSLPCLEAFEAQPAEYRREVIPRDSRRVTVEAGRTEVWKRWAGEDGLTVGIGRFGAPRPDRVIARKSGFPPEKLAERGLAWGRQSKRRESVWVRHVAGAGKSTAAT